jgi:hypothetical protein
VAPATSAAPTVGAQVNLAQSDVEGHPVGELGAQPVVEAGSQGADAPAYALGLSMTGQPGAQRGSHVGVGAFHGAHHRTGPVALLDLVAQLPHEVGPDVGVVLVRVLGDPGAVDREDHGRTHRAGPAVGDPIDADEVQDWVDGHPLALRVLALVGDGLVVDVGVVRAVTGEAPHLGAAHRRPGRDAPVVSLDHRARDSIHQELRPRRIEAGPVGGVVVVEVGAEELPGAGVGVGGAHPHPGERDVGAIRHRLGHQVLEHRRAAEQVELHQRHR